MARRGRLDLTKWLCHFVHTSSELENIYDALYPDDEDSEGESGNESSYTWKARFEYMVDWDLFAPGFGSGRIYDSDETGTAENEGSYRDRLEEDDDLDDRDDADGAEDGGIRDFRDLFPEFQWYEDYYPLKKNASALDVLFRILDTGHLRASWSFRKRRPTVYGNRAACCFTEMPLHALLQYAEARHHKLASFYGIALKRDELFRAGARPVIYGVSGPATEDRKSKWPRYLKSDEIGLSELYRYVALNITNFKNQSDWMHEREWRWPYTSQKAKCPGLPLWLTPETYSFSEICVFVATKAEAIQVVNRLKQMYDSVGEEGHHGLGEWQFERELFRKTFVISMEEAKEECLKKGIDPRMMRIEDIPRRSLLKFQSPPAPPELIERVREAIPRAREASIKAAKLFRKNYPEYEHKLCTCGYARVCCTSAQSAVVSALKVLDEEGDDTGVSAYADQGYDIDAIAVGACKWQSVYEAEAAAEGAAEVLRELLPEADFEVFSRLD